MSFSVGIDRFIIYETSARRIIARLAGWLFDALITFLRRCRINAAISRTYLRLMHLLPAIFILRELYIDAAFLISLDVSNGRDEGAP